MPRRIVLFENLEDDRRERLDHVVAPQEPVVVVVAFEGVDVGVEARESFAAREAQAHLAEDVAVAAHPCQRVEVARGRGAAHHGAQACHKLLRNERFGDVVVGTGEQVLDLVFQRAPHGEEDDRDQPCPEVAPDLGQDLVSGGVAEHQVQQDDVRTPLHRGAVRGPPVADRNALEARALQNASDESQHLLVIVDHEHQLAVGQRRARGRLVFGADLVG